MVEFSIKKLRSGGLITNYFCTSSCKHCLYNCSPQWEKRYIDIDLFGKYIPGLCSGLSVSIEDLGKPLSDQTYPIITSLYRHGIRGLIKIADDSGGFSPQKDLYLNKCDLCTEVRSFLVQNNYNGSEELNPAEFYSRS